MQPECPAAAAVDPAATANGSDLLCNVTGFDAAVFDFAVDRCRKNLDTLTRMATCGSPLAVVLLSIEAAAEAATDGYAFMQRLCGVLDPAVADSSLVVS